MKKLLILFLTVVCLLSLTACGETLEEPPELRVVSDDGIVTASQGTSSWWYKRVIGGYEGVESCSGHPLDYEDIVDTLTTDATTVELDFAVRGDSASAVECWSDEHWGNPNAESETIGLHVINDTLNVPLKPGGWVYKVTANWERENYNGNCFYVFHVVTPVYQLQP